MKKEKGQKFAVTNSVVGNKKRQGLDHQKQFPTIKKNQLI